MRLTLSFYYVVEEKMITRERKEKNIIEIKEKEQNGDYKGKKGKEHY